MTTDLHVSADGFALCAGRRYCCALGRTGVALQKREGDHCTPLGSFPLRQVFYRPDRMAAPATRLPCRALTPHDGWCDDVAAADYNRLIALPHPARHEMLWREDAVYDVIVVVGYNDAPVVPGHGSAIFLHLARDEYAGTEGCVAFARADLLAILAELATGSQVVITSGV
jgi:L,D-peptidoglycan transpeptidase YkuD (ErfK/YbiS/YcfS/YnhG family)